MVRSFSQGEFEKEFAFDNFYHMLAIGQNESRQDFRSGTEFLHSIESVSSALSTLQGTNHEGHVFIFVANQFADAIDLRKSSELSAHAFWHSLTPIGLAAEAHASQHLEGA